MGITLQPTYWLRHWLSALRTLDMKTILCAVLFATVALAQDDPIIKAADLNDDGCLEEQEIATALSNMGLGDMTDTIVGKLTEQPDAENCITPDMVKVIFGDRSEGTSSPESTKNVDDSFQGVRDSGLDPDGRIESLANPQDVETMTVEDVRDNLINALEGQSP